MHNKFNSQKYTNCCPSSVVPKFVGAFAQIKVAIISYYPQYFAVIAHNTEKIVVLVPCYSTKNHTLPPGFYLHHVWEPLS